jgi:hypothetical protein|tara:strand:- start:4138 stop:5046 length:909 start_codon:yes stop_codon:yes gene_type:complete
MNTYFSRPVILFFIIVILLFSFLILRKFRENFLSNKEVKILISEKTIDGHIRTGLPWHYAHFIHDFLLPISHYYNGSPVDIVKLETEKQSIGTFKNHFTDLFNVKCTEINKQKYTYQDKIPEIILKSYSMPHPPKHYPPKYCLPLKKWAYERYKLVPEHKHILLIKRGTAKLGTKNLKDKVGNKKLNTGSERRQLKNQYELSNKLKETYPSIFKEVELDNMSMRDQIKLFSKCKCLIGIHGAGLFNCVWLPKDSLVIELGDRLVSTIEGLSQSSECIYTHIPEHSDGVNIDFLLKSINIYLK